MGVNEAGSRRRRGGGDGGVGGCAADDAAGAAEEGSADSDNVESQAGRRQVDVCQSYMYREKFALVYL